MTLEQVLGWFIAAGAFGWITLFGLIAWVGTRVWKTVDATREEVHSLSLTMMPRDEFDRRHAELNTRVDYAHKRIDDALFTDRAEPSVSGRTSPTR